MIVGQRAARVMRAWCLGIVVYATCFASALRADEAGFERLWQALGMPSLIAIMQDEGLAQTEQLAFDYLPYPPGEGWAALSARIYDTVKMETGMHAAFQAALGEGPLDPLVTFFDSAVGKKIVALEIATRLDFLDPAVEETAQQAIRDPGFDQARLALIDTYIEVNDLVEMNVTGALNSNYNFFRGLSEGGALDLSESDMLTEVWSQEDATRSDTKDWLRAFLSASYAKLSDQELSAYIELSRSRDGKRLNRALFEGFAVIYDDIYFALGLAIADQMRAQEL